VSEAVSSSSPDFAAALERVYRGADGAKRVEQVVIRLLARLLAESNRPLTVSEVGVFDAVAPAGIEVLPGPTIIEITHSLLRAKNSRFLPDLQKAIGERGAKSVLLIGTHKLPPDRVEFVRQNAQLQDIVVEFWGPTHVAGLLERFPDAVGGLVPELGVRAVAAIVQQADSDWRERRKRHVAELRHVYFSDRLSLFLGAGASIDCGVPGWKKLITGLTLQMVDEQTPKDPANESKGMTSTERLAIASALVGAQDGSPLLVGRYLENGGVDDNGYYSSVSTVAPARRHLRRRDIQL